jgi:hypothetical protein
MGLCPQKSKHVCAFATLKCERVRSHILQPCTDQLRRNSRGQGLTSTHSGMMLDAHDGCIFAAD